MIYNKDKMEGKYANSLSPPKINACAPMTKNDSAQAKGVASLSVPLIMIMVTPLEF